MRRSWYIASLAVALFAAGCSDSNPPAQAASRGEPPPAPVQVEAVGPGNLTDGWTFLGQVEPALQAEIAAAVAGHVQKVSVREGDQVSKGQLLITLDGAQLRAQLDAARARERGLTTELALAEKQLARIEPLQYPTVSEAERERFELAAANLRAQLEAQKAERERVQVALGHHTIRAPFAGTVQARHVDPGAWINVGQAMLGLVSLDEVEVHVQVSAELGARLRPGGPARLKGPTEVAAEIRGVVPALDRTTRTMRVRLVPLERPAWLISGMPLDVGFDVELSGEGVTVSRDAVLRGAVGARVIKVTDGKGVPVEVEILASAGDRVLVRAEELAVGDQVVVRGNERLRPGQPLKVLE